MTIGLYDVTVDLPVYSVSAQSIRKHLLTRGLGGALFRKSNDAISIRALDSVTLRIGDGDRVGIVGPNGAGKTTLLRVLSGVYTPTTGRVEVQGEISSALNVGVGLDSEISGRENIYLLGYYRGFSRERISRQIEEIIEATRLGVFIDLPVNTYSAGMIGRLTFAVATAFDPDVLLMDEWLFAGDASFLQDAKARVEGFVRKARVLVLASHNSHVIREFCTRAIYLNGGRLIDFGDVDQVISRYEADAAQA